MFAGSSNSFDLPRTRLSEYFPFLCDKDGKKLPKGDLLLMQRELDEHTEKIKRTFAVLVLDLQNNIEEEGKTRIPTDGTEQLGASASLLNTAHRTGLNSQCPYPIQATT